MGKLFTEACRIALISAGKFEYANPDTDLACCKCDIPLLERQAVWADDETPYCGPCAVEAEQRAIAEDKDTEERIGEYSK